MRLNDLLHVMDDNTNIVVTDLLKRKDVYEGKVGFIQCDFDGYNVSPETLNKNVISVWYSTIQKAIVIDV